MVIRLLVLLAGMTLPQAPSPQLVFEHAARAHFTADDGVITLREGNGWLRYNRVFLDFEATFEFKVASPRTDAGVVVRSGVGGGHWPQSGYRIKLPARPTADGAALFESRRRQATVVERGAVMLRADREWQSARIKADGKRVGLAINDQAVFVAEIESLGGFLLFDNRNGKVQIRNVRLAYATPASMGDPIDISSAETKALVTQGVFQDPEPLLEVRPEYTRGAMQRMVEGVVVTEAVVLPDGTVGQTRVIKSLDPELDQQAVAAVRQWMFVPGRRNGRPVPTLVTVELTFTR